MNGEGRRYLYEVLYVIIFAELLLVLIFLHVAFTNFDTNFENGIVNTDENRMPIKATFGFSFGSSFGEPLNLTKNFLTCREIDQMEIGGAIGRGTTKSVFSGKFAGNKVAVKMVTEKVRDITACKRTKGRHHLDSCYKFAYYKVIKEIALLQQLQHPNVAKLLGYCIHSGENAVPAENVVMVMELGRKVDTKNLSWPKKLQVSLDLAELLHFLHHSPIGPVRIGDFKRDQFRLINDTLKLSDLDDLTTENKTCKTNGDCLILNNNYGIPCVQSVCKGFNTAANVKVATKLFLSGILSKAPEVVRKEAGDLLKDLMNTNMDTRELKERVTCIQKKV